ncbi:alpha/beta fold hydrolase [Chengkuizengella axinellae]|uniref:Alpha/beta hydrolase n=1 Tax=Chengkuizengella axinellae TaxID=3064388 RepID=A0ABT9J1Q1_9BACL|nr:alpha/beta hydrolase [Chengkuizengella sp. 2205SS18-9]MDP5274934.1 alpha/beta hydrolase [Chengkuizengella sp. 2205SS18-9]
MDTWKRELISTSRGTFEVFEKGNGEPLCITHLYSEFNESGDYFAKTFTETHRVILVNLREAGDSEKAVHAYELSMLETVFDLEAIREALHLKTWGYAGHSTGGILGLVYGIYFSVSLEFLIVVGAAARDYMTFSKDCIYHAEHPLFHKMQDLIESLKQPDLTPEDRKEISIERTKLSLVKPEKYTEYFNRNISKKMSRIRMDYFAREMQLLDVTKKLKLIIVPTLIMCGKYDVQCPLEYSFEINQLIPGSKLVVFDHSNHYPFLEEEKLFLKEVNLFLKG